MTTTTSLPDAHGANTRYLHGADEFVVVELAEGMSLEVNMRSMAITKRLVNRSLDSDRTTAFGEEADSVELNMTTRDANEGVASLMERRKPEYYGW